MYLPRTGYDSLHGICNITFIAQIVRFPYNRHHIAHAHDISVATVEAQKLETQRVLGMHVDINTSDYFLM